MHTSPQKIGLIYFVGIGGIGMSGIAEVLHNLGYSVAGSDISRNYNCERLKGLGIVVHDQHAPENIDNAAVVVISSAVTARNPELVAARAQNIPVIRRADMLAELMRLKPSIAVSGTHGKTTTTSLVAAILDGGSFDPTVVNGGIINAYGTNARLGTGEWMVVEADESDGSFTALPHTIGIITNIDPEHLDHYGSFAKIKDAFIEFFQNIPFYGLGVVCRDHPSVAELLPQFKDRRLITYGTSPNADIFAENLQFAPQGVTFDLVCQPSSYKIFKRSQVYWEASSQPTRFEHIFLPLQGEHNVLNCLSALAVGFELGISIEHMRSALKSFAGVKRRFTLVGEVEGRKIIDDYAHHPVEIATVLKAARHAATGQVIAVVQPHRYTRLHSLMNEFASCFHSADVVIVTPVYSAGEEPIAGADHTALFEKIKENTDKCVFIAQDKKETINLIAKYSRNEDIIIYLGAGDVTYWAQEAPASLAEALGQTKESRHA